MGCGDGVALGEMLGGWDGERSSRFVWLTGRVADTRIVDGYSSHRLSSISGFEVEFGL